MDLALIAAAGLLGLTGAPHCAAMCGAPCAAIGRRCGGARAVGAFLGGRLISYAAGGALVAAGVALFQQLGAWVPALRPLWVMVHLAALGAGLWLIVTGRLPRWRPFLATPSVTALASPLAASTWAADTGGGAGGWQPMAGPLKAGATGALWIAMPCGLLQSALLVAALANTPWGGAAAMGAFAIASSLGLGALPAVWSGRVGGDALAARLAGAMLVAGALFALGHGLWEPFLAWCGI